MRWDWLVLVAALVGCSSSHSGSGTSSPPPPGPTLIQTDSGPVQGVAQDTVRQFNGIPFAAPPVGDLRWKPPADVTPWTSPLDATQEKPPCVSFDLQGDVDTGTSEDCLTLNVWTPLAQTTNAPVMVWIYGGAFVGGQATDPGYDGSVLAAGQNVIVVTFNYRLGPLGFLSSAALAAEEGVATAPSFGLLDQRAALQWVQRNIAAFGGNPGNVTLFGESAGAWSTCIHLAMPGSAGLFQNAIMESGNCGSTPTLLYFTPAAAQAQAEQLAQAPTVNCTDPSTELACLRAVAPNTLLTALPSRTADIDAPGVDWGPVVDGVQLPSLPTIALTAGTFNKVPLVIGTNHDEGNLFTYLYGTTATIDASVVQGVAQTNFGSNAAAVLARYTTSAYATPQASVSAILTYGVFACPTRLAARAISAAGVPVYLYQFTHPFSPGLASGLGAAHTFEIPYVWGNTWLGARPPDTDQPLIDSMQAYWGQLATTGNPNGGGQPAWPAYAMATDQNMVLDLTLATASGLDSDECDFWDALPPQM
jgi:para-nitrobenzyl esterase